MKKNFYYKDEHISTSSEKFIPKEIYTQILEYIPIVCVDLVIVKNNHVFLIKRKNKPSKGVFWVQGGRLNKNELPEDAGLRKAAAELKIDPERIKIIKYLGTFSTEFNDSEQGSTSHTINITYQAEINVEPNFDADHSDGMWFPIDGTNPKELHSQYSHHPYIKHLLTLVAK